MSPVPRLLKPGDLVKLELEDPDLPDPKYFRAFQESGVRHGRPYLVKLGAVGVVMSIDGNLPPAPAPVGEGTIYSHGWATIIFNKNSYIKGAPGSGKVCLPVDRLRSVNK